MVRPALLFAFLLCAAPLQALSLRLTARNALAENRSNVAVTWSVPLAIRDDVRDTSALALMAGGTPIPAQFTALARWGGGPVSWLLVDTRLDLQSRETRELMLVSQQVALPGSALRILRNDAEGITIATGAAMYEMSKTAFRLFDRVTLATGEIFPASGGLRFNGRMLDGPCSLAVEHHGRERISLRGRGTIEGDLEYTIRIHFYRDLAEVKTELRIENMAAPLVIDGQPQDNEYGSQGSVSFDDFTIVVPSRGAGGYEISSQQGTFTTRVSLVQESSGDDRWDALRSMAPRLQSGVAKRASTLRVDENAIDGPNQISGWLDAGGVTVAIHEAWQNFPKALRATAFQVEAGLFPSEFSRNHELRPGEFKTHTMWIRHHATVSDVASRARSLLAPVRLLATAEQTSRSMAAGLMAPRMRTEFGDYEAGIDYQITESPQWRPGEYDARTILDAISISQNYGWVDYGDIPTDFEGMTSPYNMKYDSLRGLLLQALRTDDDVWWSLGLAAARHVADFDIHHGRPRGYATARRWFEGGMYGHGYHDEDGRLNPHRNYMNTSSSMAGPAAGLFVWALASGDTLLMESAVEAADNLYWKTTNTNYDEAAPGAAACARNAGLQLCGDDCQGYEPADVSRTGGHIAQAMISAYAATGDPAYLDLIRRMAAYVACVEPSIIPQTCNRFHFQSIFVRSLGHYLMVREALSLPDDATARGILQKRMDYMTGTLWDGTAQRFRMCYYDDVVDTTLTPIEDNWLLAVADAFATGSLVLRRSDLLTQYAQPLFRYGSANQFYPGSAISYHSAKEFVNQVGFGQMFLYAWSQQTLPPPATPARRRAVRR